MEIEYEATFANINKYQVREKLRQLGAKIVKPEILMKRVVLWMPKGHEIEGGWLRVRDEGDKITMTFKVVDGNEIHNQKEINLTIDNFDNGVAFLESVGAKRKSYQETKLSLIKTLWNDDLIRCQPTNCAMRILTVTGLAV
jgi:adenylate cyclase class 2